MDRYLSASDKFDLQQNYRRFLKYQEQFTLSNDALKEARASRVWIAALVMLLFALASDFFLGASAALFGLYFYRVALARITSYNVCYTKLLRLAFFDSYLNSTDVYAGAQLLYTARLYSYNFV